MSTKNTRPPVEKDVELIADEIELKYDDPKQYKEVLQEPHEGLSEAHQLLRSYIGHKHQEQEETV